VQVNGAVPQNGQLEQAGEIAMPARSPAGPIWVAAGACLAVLTYCAVNQYWLGVIASAVGFVAAVAGGLAARSTPKVACPPIGSIGGPYGNGPYRKIQCAPNGKVVATLAEITNKLRELPAKEAGNGKVDWSAFDKAVAEARAATERSEFVAAVTAYGAGIRGIMRQLRDTRPTVDRP
jgi:hypothetical protein